jgi:hypothetical protein
MAFRKTRSEGSKPSGSKKGGSGNAVGGRVAEAKKGYAVEGGEGGASKKKAVYRNALTGRFVTAEQPSSSPRTTGLSERKSTSSRPQASERTQAGQGRTRSSKPAEKWTRSDEVLITRLANAARRSQTEDGTDISGLSDVDLFKALFG